MSRCPDRLVLGKYEAGDLSDDEADRIEPHVSACTTCMEVLERLRHDNLDARVIRAALNDESTVSVVGGSQRTARGEVAGTAWDIPDYQRVLLCGTGAYGAVWAVRDRLGLHRALKTIDLARLGHDSVECRESTALEVYCRRVQQHPNLIHIFHVGMRGSVLYYTMELADDARTRRQVRDALTKQYRPLTLRSVMSKGPLRVDTAVEVTLRLLHGLSRLHATGLAHRDIKPANIVFVDRQPKLADIGMITANIATPSHVGTPDYMPPDGQMGLSADVYAMGRVLFDMIVGLGAGGYPDVPKSVDDVTGKWNMQRLREVLAKAGAREPDMRFKGAGEMLEAIEQCRDLTYESLLADLEPMTNVAPANRSRHVPIVVAAISAAPWVVLGLIVLVLIIKLL